MSRPDDRGGREPEAPMTPNDPAAPVRGARVHCVLVAAGSGTRLGDRGPKAFVELAGRPLLAHALEGLARSDVVDSIVVVGPAGRIPDAEAASRSALASAGWTGPFAVVPGGSTRQGSVVAGLTALDDLAAPDGDDVVLVHDAARCLTPGTQIRDVVAAVVGGHGAVIPVVPVTDTLKRVGEASADGTEPVTATVDRAVLRAVQTPQGFTCAVVRGAHEFGVERAGDEALAATDDGCLVEAAGGEVVVVPGSMEALKVTTPWDLRVAELILAGR
jgi:2-C-methyl-D-erythritol 4-phosphate cytidylyltransferase